MLKFESKWVKREEEVLPVEAIPNNLSCYTLILGERAFHQEEWNGETHVKTEFDGKVKPWIEKFKLRTGYFVTVDYHC